MTRQQAAWFGGFLAVLAVLPAVPTAAWGQSHVVGNGGTATLASGECIQWSAGVSWVAGFELTGGQELEQGVLHAVNGLVGPCVADLDGNGIVAIGDLLALLSDYGCLAGCAADLNGDGIVTTADLLTMLSAMGTSCN